MYLCCCCSLAGVLTLAYSSKTLIAQALMFDSFTLLRKAACIVWMLWPQTRETPGPTMLLNLWLRREHGLMQRNVLLKSPLSLSLSCCCFLTLCISMSACINTFLGLWSCLWGHAKREARADRALLLSQRFTAAHGGTDTKERRECRDGCRICFFGWGSKKMKEPCVHEFNQKEKNMLLIYECNFLFYSWYFPQCCPLELIIPWFRPHGACQVMLLALLIWSFSICLSWKISATWRSKHFEGGFLLDVLPLTDKCFVCCLGMVSMGPEVISGLLVGLYKYLLLRYRGISYEFLLVGRRWRFRIARGNEHEGCQSLLVHRSQKVSFDS